jgi:cytochrome c oxidase subunit 1
MSVATAVPEILDHAHAEHAHENFFRKYLWSTDHKMIAMQYLFTGMVMALIGGYLSYVFRMQLAFPGQRIAGFGYITPGQYNALVTMHGTIMIFWVAMPVLVAAFGNFLIPLMIGCDDMAFPRINRLSYQVFLLSAIVLVASFFVHGGAFAGAWTAYPPLSSKAAYNLTPIGAPMWLLAVALEFVAFLLGGINFVVTAMNSRAPGMGLFDIPIVVWMIVIATLVFMGSVGPLVAGAVMLLLDQVIGTGFYDPMRGGDPVLWQHLFWFFGHPEVYVLLLPAMGIVTEVLTVFSRKKLFGYKALLYSTWSVGILSFLVWAHHQFVAGIDPRMAAVFSITTLFISVPVGTEIFVSIATLYGGSIQLTTAMLWAVAFIAEFLIGGVTGIFLGSSATDIYLHDTYFLVAHFHYTMVPLALFATFAGLSYWFPKMFGRMLNETLGKIHFWGTVISFNCVFIPLFVTGLAGDQRRIYDYSRFAEQMRPELQHLRYISTIAAIFLLSFQAFFLFNFFWSMWRGPRASANPWHANTLEWSTSSPPPHGNFAEMPVVYRPPYEYGVPGRADDYWPQNVPS